MRNSAVIIAFTFLLFLSSTLSAQKVLCSDASDLRAWKTTVLMNYQSTKPEEKRLAIDASKKYVEKTGRCGIKDDFTSWINSHEPDWERASGPTPKPATAPALTPVSEYDAELARKLGADERGMKMYVLCILKTGPKDGEFTGKARDDIFAGHFANIGRLADEGKLAIAGPFEKNDRSYRGLYVFNVPTIAEAEKLVVLDPAVKAGVFVPELTLWYGSAALMATPDIHKRIQKPQSKTN
jgi:uncharacterized protein YciI